MDQLAPHILRDGDFSGEIVQNGLWPKAHPDEPERAAFSLTIRHEKLGVLETIPQCASNQGFCAAVFVQFVNRWREDEASRQTENNGDGH